MKKILSLLLVLSLVLTFSACDSLTFNNKNTTDNEPLGVVQTEGLQDAGEEIEAFESEETQTEAETEEAEETQAQEPEADPYEQYNAAMKAYKSVLLGLNDENTDWGVDKCRFKLANIDDDEIPELIVSLGSAHVSRCLVYSFVDTEAVNAGEFGEYGDMMYYEEQGVIKNDRFTHGDTVSNLIKLENGETEEIWFGFSEIDEDSGEERFYREDRVEVSEDEFFDSLNEVTPSGKPTAFDRDTAYEITAGNIANVLGV